MVYVDPLLLETDMDPAADDDAVIVELSDAAGHDDAVVVSGNVVVSDEVERAEAARGGSTLAQTLLVFGGMFFGAWTDMMEPMVRLNGKNP